MVEVIDLGDRAVDALPVARRNGQVIDPSVGGTELRFYRALGKRSLDILLALLSSVVVVPLLAVLIALVAFDGGSPIYTQERVGQKGRKFKLLKLRTMVPDAEDALVRLLRGDPERAHEWNTTQKLREDPRVTRLGRFLRASSLDELPQFWNVLRGDMSLVGPRPMMPDQQPLYDGQVYCDLRPGVTGLWQVSARNASSFSSRVDYDREYDARLSFLFDLRLLLRTIAVVSRGTGC